MYRKRAQQVAGDGQLGVAANQRQAEVGHPQFAASVEKQIGRLDVAVDDAGLMGIFQRFGRLDGEPCRGPAVFIAGGRAGGQSAGPACGARGRGGRPGWRAGRAVRELPPAGSAPR